MAPPFSRLIGPARRPACSSAILLILGILSHRALPDLPNTWIALAVAAAIASLVAGRFPKLSIASLALALSLTGLSIAQLQHFHFPANHITAYATDASRLAELQLQIDQPPRILTSPTPASRPMPPRQVTQATVIKVKTLTGWQDSSGQILLSLQQPNTHLQAGQTVKALGLLSRPAPAMNPGQFDWSAYYRDQRILVALDCPHADNIQILTPAGFQPLQWLRAKARDALAQGFSKEQSLDHALLRALLLGDSDPQLADTQQDFIRTGTSHHLSISGMHIAVLGGFVFLLCRLARLSPRLSAILMLAFVLLYGLVALPSPPVLRSIILCLCFGIGIILRKSVDGLQLLALTVFIMLAVQPLDLYNAGFQLSFGTVLGLMLFASPLTKLIDRENIDDKVLLSLGIAPTRMQSLRRWAKSAFLASVACGLVAWLISAPLIVEHFDQMNPYAIPAGMLLALPVFIAMIAGLLKVVLTLLCPWLAPFWALLATLPIEVMRHGVALLAKIPGSDLPLPALPTLAILIYYILLALPIIPTPRTRLRLAFRGGAITAALIAFSLPLLVGLAPRADSTNLTVTLLSVGAGQCAVVQTPNGKTFLIDAGSSTITDLERKCLEPYLRHVGVTHLDAIFVSHANYDHFSAVAQAAETYHAHEVLVTPMFLTDAQKNYPARMMLNKLDSLKIPVKTTLAGQNILLDNNVTLEILWPPNDPTLTDNNSSQVMRLTCQGARILFTGDIQIPTERALTQSANIAADVVIAPHHGSLEPTTASFIDATGAQTILASNDRTLSRKQKDFDDLMTTQTLLRTHNKGAITVKVTKSGEIKIQTFLK